MTDTKLCWENVERKEPVVEIDGKAVHTRGGIPVEIPAHLASEFKNVIAVPYETATVMF